MTLFPHELHKCVTVRIMTAAFNLAMYLEWISELVQCKTPDPVSRKKVRCTLRQDPYPVTTNPRSKCPILYQRVIIRRLLGSRPELG